MLQHGGGPLSDQVARKPRSLLVKSFNGQLLGAYFSAVSSRISFANRMQSKTDLTDMCYTAYYKTISKVLYTGRHPARLATTAKRRVSGAWCGLLIRERAVFLAVARRPPPPPCPPFLM